MFINHMVIKGSCLYIYAWNHGTSVMRMKGYVCKLESLYMCVMTSGVQVFCVQAGIEFVMANRFMATPTFNKMHM